MNLSGFKPILKSKTIWAGAIAAVSGVLVLFGHAAITDPDQKLAIDLISEGVDIICGLVAIYGRYTATKKLS